MPAIVVLMSSICPWLQQLRLWQAAPACQTCDQWNCLAGVCWSKKLHVQEFLHEAQICLHGGYVSQVIGSQSLLQADKFGNLLRTIYESDATLKFNDALTIHSITEVYSMRLLEGRASHMHICSNFSALVNLAWCTTACMLIAGCCAPLLLVYPLLAPACCCGHRT